MYSFDGLDRDLDKRLHALSGNKYLSLIKAAKEEKAKEFNFLLGPHSVSSTEQGVRATEMPSLVPI